MTPIYGSTSALRAQSNSNSPGNGHGQPSSALLVVPQPINATKMTSGLSNGTGRKYQCKMCPQVRQFVSQLIFTMATKTYIFMKTNGIRFCFYFVHFGSSTFKMRGGFGNLGDERFED